VMGAAIAETPVTVIGRAVPQLMRAGVEPDMLRLTDPHPWLHHHFRLRC
jgi:hypothetical protein